MKAPTVRAPSEWLKLLLPIVLALVLNQGRISNCEADNTQRGVLREILLLAPGEGREYEDFLERALALIPSRECGFLPW